MLQQVSIYAENKKGMFREITRLLGENDINILGSVTNDSAEYGIIRMVVSDPAKTVKVLTDAGIICKTSRVLGIELKDEVGSLDQLLTAMLDMNINLDYLYLSFNRSSGMPVMILHAENVAELESFLKDRGYTSL